MFIRHCEMSTPSVCTINWRDFQTSINIFSSIQCDLFCYVFITLSKRGSSRLFCRAEYPIQTKMGACMWNHYQHRHLFFSKIEQAQLGNNIAVKVLIPVEILQIIASLIENLTRKEF